jgi:hypothetical protein
MESPLTTGSWKKQERVAQILENLEFDTKEG